MKLAFLRTGLLAACVTGCGAGASGGSLFRGCTVKAIPLQPPDTVPQWVYHPRNAVRGTRVTDMYARDVLVISFVPRTDERRRAEAICAVQLIGGQRPDGAEGLYYVRIPSDPAQQRMRGAVAILDALPQVNLVTPEFVDNALGPAVT